MSNSGSDPDTEVLSVQCSATKLAFALWSHAGRDPHCSDS